MSGFSITKNNDTKIKAKVKGIDEPHALDFFSPNEAPHEPTQRVTNLNGIAEDQKLKQALPIEIQLAISEWANQLKDMPWKLKRRAIKRFSGSFADNFLAIMPHLNDEEYESLAVLGLTCLLEELDTGGPISNIDQAKCYIESEHKYHQSIGQSFLIANSKEKNSLH
ncbi:hypothetical protein N8156_02855 [Rhodospirillaceae bacterium]|jgi:hypothetical protein|nr:hypothetical protein [Rhodospirillaceae bacterium]